MSKLLGFIFIFLLAACETTEGPSRPVEVGIATSREPCKVPVIDCGRYAVDTVSEADRLIRKGRAALAELRQREACEIKLRAALRECAQ